MQIGIACDHGGFELKEELKVFLKTIHLEPVDLGTFNEDSVDYPDFGIRVAEKVSSGEWDRGILICGTGVGMSIVANKFPRVRAALVNELYSARCSREHNDSNILVIGGRIVGRGLAKEILRIWLETPFSGGRHQRRVDKIAALEQKNFKGSKT
ncbi:MAG: ribose 5-phosphate isomerase B [Deltaproteobacteria bacterium RBG_13_53_10]|nr:MAG: ribose 5-phosphate isomerase B [Deltaproteobacteria bacterium RBG_13_53_10]